MQCNRSSLPVKAICFRTKLIVFLFILAGCATAPNENTPKAANWHTDPDSASRPVRITVTGEVKRPGSYAFPAEVKFSELLNRAGNFTDYAYLRRIQIIHRDGTKQICDFRQVAQRPESNLTLGDGDRVAVSKIPL